MTRDERMAVSLPNQDAPSEISPPGSKIDTSALRASSIV